MMILHFTTNYRFERRPNRILPSTGDSRVVRVNLQGEMDQLNKLARGLEFEDANLMSKSLSEESTVGLRGRNRDESRRDRARDKRAF